MTVYSLASLGFPLLVGARVVAAGQMMIVVVQVGEASNAAAEFVRIANAGTTAFDLTGWRLQYKSASGASWTTKVILSGGVGAGSQLLVSTSSYTTSEMHVLMSDGLAAAGGHLQLIDKQGTVRDLVGWGSALYPENKSAPAPSTSQLLRRKTSTTDGYIDTDNNSLDFELIPQKPITPSPSPSPSVDPPPVVTELLPPIITEMLPNPASPLVDAYDEFVEIYNPNTETIVLKNYMLQTGGTFSHSVVFSSETLEAGGYLLVKSKGTALSLSNASGTARLVDPNGAVVDLVADYKAALPGISWSLIEGSWQWTTTPTPGDQNILTMPPANTSAPAKGATSTAPPAPKLKTPSSTSQTKSPVAKSAKVVKEPATKSSKATGANSPSSSSKTTPSQSATNIHPIVLVVVGSLAVLYGLYEYRHDLGNLIYKLRRNRTAGGVDRSEIARGRGDRAAERPGWRQDHLGTRFGSRFGLGRSRKQPDIYAGADIPSAARGSSFRFIPFGRIRGAGPRIARVFGRGGSG